MAFSNPHVYMKELASPLLERFEAEPESYDLAIATSIVLYHFSDVVGHVRSQNGPAAADDIAKRVPQFDTVRAIANAGKHVELTRHPNKAVIGLRAEHLMRAKKADVGVIVTTPDDKMHNVLEVCRTTFDALMSQNEFFHV